MQSTNEPAPKPAPIIAHRIEYDRLALAVEGDEGLRRWAHRFERAWLDGRTDECRQLLIGIKGSGISLSDTSRATVLRCQGLLALLQEEYHRAETDFQTALALCEETGDDLVAGRLLNDLGTLDQARGDLPAAVEHYRASLQRLPPTENGAGDAAMVRNNLGLALVSLGERAAGLAEFEQARAIYERLGYPQGVARTQINLGQLYARQGDHAAATAAYQEALATLRRFGEGRLVVEVLNSLGVLAKTQGQFEQATDYYTQSLALAQEASDLGGQAQALGNLGAIYHHQGLLERARPCYREALAHYEALGDLRGQGLMWGNLGQLEGLQDRPEDALAAHQRSLDLYRQAGANLDAGIAQVNLAGALRTLDRQDEAEALYLPAIETGRQLGDLRLQDRALGGLAILRSLQGRFAEARELLERTLDLQRQRGDIPAQIETLYKYGVVARDEGQKEAQLAEILRPAWDLAQEHDAGRWLVAIASLLGDAAVDERLPQAYNYYATAAAVARQHGDERRYRISMDTIRRNVEELIEHDQAEDAAFVCRYVIECWEKLGLAGWVEDGIAEVESWNHFRSERSGDRVGISQAGPERGKT